MRLPGLRAVVRRGDERQLNHGGHRGKLTLFLLADFFAPGFEILFYLRHELIGYCAVDQAVIVA